MATRLYAHRPIRQMVAAPPLVALAFTPILRGLYSKPGGDKRMRSAVIDVVGIGNPIVDVIAHADEKFLVDEDLAHRARCDRQEVHPIVGCCAAAE